MKKNLSMYNNKKKIEDKYITYYTIINKLFIIQLIWIYVINIDRMCENLLWRFIINKIDKEDV